MYRFRWQVIALALLVAGCGGSDTSLTGPTTNPNTTIDFTSDTNGPLTPHGSQSFPFNSLQAGSVSVQLMSLSPDGPNGALVGLELGVWDGTACQRVVHNDKVTLSSTVIANATTAGNLCASIYDSAGTLPGPQTFDIQVSHP